MPLAAGSGMDSIVRLYAEPLAQALGKPIVVENKPGAALMLAANAVATAPPDGHTLLISTSSAMAINPVLYKAITYKPNEDFVPISFYVKSPFVLVVDPALPVKSVPELIKFAKESQKPLNYSSPGAGVCAASVDGVHEAAFRPRHRAMCPTAIHRSRSRTLLPATSTWALPNSAPRCR